jgi:hypothetical protein
MRIDVPLVFLLALATPAFAQSSWPDEKTVLAATGRAFVAGRVQHDPAAALAYCKAVDDQFSARGGYLAALVERCYADSQDDKAEKCVRYARAVALWNGPPGPLPDPGFQADRDFMFQVIVGWRKANCQ